MTYRELREEVEKMSEERKDQTVQVQDKSSEFFHVELINEKMASTDFLQIV